MNPRIASCKSEARIAENWIKNVHNFPSIFFNLIKLESDEIGLNAPNLIKKGLASCNTSKQPS